MSKKAEVDQTALANSGPVTEIVVPSNVTPRNADGLIGIAVTGGDDVPLDALDTAMLAAMNPHALARGVDIAKFEIRSLKELVYYPGGSYINWTMVFTSKQTRKVLRSDAFLMPRNDFYVVIGELLAIQ